jgi:Sec-independent protein translocase protein TatA
MEILGIGPLEFILILMIALIIFSPKDLAKGGKEIGRFINRLYRSEAWKSMRQVSQEMQDLPSRLAREAQLDDLKDLEKDILKAGDAQLSAVKDMEKDMRLEAGSPYRDRPSVPQMPPARPETDNQTAEPKQPESKPEPSSEKKDSGET